MNDQLGACDTIRLRDAESIHFLYAVCSRDKGSRIQAIDNAERIIDSWLEGYGSPKESSFLDQSNGHDVENDTMKLLVREQLPDILRLSIQCPFTDVRDRCGQLLDDLKDRGIKIPRRTWSGPSNFIPDDEVVPIDSDSDQNLFVDAFLHNNRLEHMIQVMGYHPCYLEAFLKTQQYLMRGDGPLSYDYRHYIAIMAAGRHQCSYLVNIQVNEFLLQGGDERWLKGLEHVPKKLRDLYEVNKILAHRPWLLSKSHIEKLTQGNDNWSLSELTHAIVLLAHFHALSSFVYGCGINAEIDQSNGHTFRPPSMSDAANGDVLSQPHSPVSHSSTPNSPGDVEGGIEALMERMRQLTETASQEEMTQEELQLAFEKVGKQNAELISVGVQPQPKGDILRFVDDAEFVYQDFAKRGCPSDIPTFRAQDYSWEEQGFSLANRLYADIGTYLDDKFRNIYNLTYYTMGHNKDVDTSSFRRAIWNYIHCMFGIRHDDFDYQEVNQLLERSLKSYIKTVTCYPERTTKRDYDSFMRGLKHSEKVHVNLMLVEARIQAELLYALRAIMRHMT